MRASSWFTAAACLFAATVASPAAADSMDPALARLVKNGSCRTGGPGGTGVYNDPSSIQRCTTDDAAFAKLVSQYGGAIAPTGMHTASTTGYGGFELAVEAAFTKIDSDAEYWKNGTRGPQQESTKLFSVRNDSPDSFLSTYTLKIRKGFPLGFELVGNVGVMGNTSIVLGGADVRWSLFEGFRSGVPGVFPELAVGGSVRTISGTSELTLTVAGFDGTLSKAIPIAGAVELTPYVGYQWVRIFGDSGSIDLTPNSDAINDCGYLGPNTPGTPDPNKKGENGGDVYDGQPVCSGSNTDFNNNVVFDPVRMTRHRLNFGTQFRFEYIRVGAHFLTDLADPADVNTSEDDIDSATGENRFDGVPKQWTLAFDVAAVF